MHVCPSLSSGVCARAATSGGGCVECDACRSSSHSPHNVIITNPYVRFMNGWMGGFWRSLHTLHTHMYTHTMHYVACVCICLIWFLESEIKCTLDEITASHYSNFPSENNIYFSKRILKGTNSVLLPSSKFPPAFVLRHCFGDDGHFPRHFPAVEQCYSLHVGGYGPIQPDFSILLEASIVRDPLIDARTNVVGEVVDSGS